MKSVFPPGTEIPGLGSVVASRPLFGIRERMLGRLHRDSQMSILTFSDGSVAKAIVEYNPANTDDSGRAPETRTQRAARYLAEVGQRVRVPAVKYCDRQRLVVEYLPGRRLVAGEVESGRIIELARYICAGQVAPQYGPLPSVQELAQRVANDKELSAVVSRLSRSEHMFGDGDAAVPQGVCFSDAALKNFIVHEADDSIVYVDAFGLSFKPVGMVFVKQALRIPQRLREGFINAYMASSPYAEDIRVRLREYLVRHFLERAEIRSGELNPMHNTGKTLYRRRRRNKGYRLAVEAIRSCAQLSASPSAGHDWLISVDYTE